MLWVYQALDYCKVKVSGYFIVAMLFRYHPSCFLQQFPLNPSLTTDRLHFLREHQIPIYCPRCSQTFKSSDEKDEHQREENPCQILPSQTWDGINEIQKKQLKKRVSTKNTVVESWNLIYKILFPDSPLPDSPCTFLGYVFQCFC